MHFYTGAQCVCERVCVCACVSACVCDSLCTYIHSKCAFVSNFKEKDRSKTA